MELNQIVLESIISLDEHSVLYRPVLSFVLPEYDELTRSFRLSQFSTSRFKCFCSSNTDAVFPRIACIFKYLILGSNS